MVNQKEFLEIVKDIFLTAHKQAIEATSRLPENQKVTKGRINEGNLSFAAWQLADIIKQADEKKDIFPALADFFLKMAYNYHIFIDGNKRTSYILVKIILYADGFHLKTRYDKDYRFIVDVASGTKDVKKVEEWLRNKSEKLGENTGIDIEDELKSGYIG